jgi:hypothetical protein
MYTSNIDAPKGETEHDIIRSIDLAPPPLGSGGRWELYEEAPQRPHVERGLIVRAPVAGYHYCPVTELETVT